MSKFTANMGWQAVLPVEASFSSCPPQRVTPSRKLSTSTHAATCRPPDAADESEAWAVVLDVSRNGKQLGQLKLDLAANQRCVFGRQPGGCDVVMEHLSISRQHAHLSMDVQGRCFVTDMASGLLLLMWVCDTSWLHAEDCTRAIVQLQLCMNIQDN